MKVTVIITSARDSEKTIQAFLDANPGIEIVALQSTSSIDGTKFHREIVSEWFIATTIIYKDALDTSDCD